MNLTQMAWRNVWRTRRRSLVTMSAMSLALLIMIIYSGLVEGYMVNMKRNILDIELGEIQVHAQGFRKSPSLYKKVENDSELAQQLESDGFRVSPRLLGTALGAAGSSSAGIQIRGVDVQRDAQVSQIHQHVHHGTWLSDKEAKGVVIGRRLAKTLGLKVGGELVVLGQAADGSMANDVYVVVGVLKGITDWVDRAGVYMHASSFRELFVLDTGSHQLIVRSPEGLGLDSATGQVRELAPDLETQSWKELLPSLASMFENSNASMMMMYLIFYLAIGMVILNAMLMSVFERVREFGVLKAIGGSPGRILSLILFESGAQAVISVIVASAMAWPCLWWLKEHGIDLTSFGSMSIAGVAFDPIWRAEIGQAAFVPPIVTLLVIVFLAVLYPAIKAALISPAEAMHHR